MKELITFASAIADTTRLRILSLALDHKTSAVEISDVLKQPLVEISQQIEHLSLAGLLKTDQEGKLVRLKHKPHKLLNVIFEHLAISAKKDPILRKDAKLAKLAKLWREVKQSEKKSSRRALKAKSKELKKTQKTKKSVNAKSSKSKAKS